MGIITGISLLVKTTTTGGFAVIVFLQPE